MLKRCLGNRKGVAIIEFAFVLPILLVFLGGAIDFGVAFFVSHTVQNAAREGARLGVSMEDLTPDDARVRQRVLDRLPSGSLFDPFRANISQTFANCEVSVTVEGPSPYFFLQIINLDSLTIERNVTMRYEHCPS